MDNQLPLLPHSGKETSLEAAESMSSKAGAIREQVYQFIKRCGDYGCTRDEIEAYTGYAGNTVRPRVWELVKRKRVVECADTRLTRAGRKAEILRVVA